VTQIPLGELTVLPQASAIFKGLTFKGRKVEWEGRRRERRGKERKGTREGPMKSVKPRACKVASAILTALTNWTV